MTFEDKEKEVVLDAFHTIGKGDLTMWIFREDIINEASKTISLQKANTIFNTFINIENLYIQSRNNTHYSLSGPGRLYYEYLKKESTKYDADIAGINSTLETSKLTRTNIKIGWFFGGTTLLALILNIGITTYKEAKESHHQLRDSLQQTRMQQNSLEQNLILLEISRVLSDTSTKKVRIEK